MRSPQRERASPFDVSAVQRQGRPIPATPRFLAAMRRLKTANKYLFFRCLDADGR